MPPIDDRLKGLPEMARSILRKALMEGAGHWEGAASFQVEELGDWFPVQTPASVAEALEALEADRLWEVTKGRHQMTQEGYLAARALGRWVEEDPLALLDDTPPTAPEGMPFPVDNPRQTSWAISNAFLADLKKLDPSLYDDAAEEMAHTLSWPDRGKWLRNKWHGTRQSKFNKHYRLRWTPRADGSVEFNRIGHKNSIQ